jgi:hypothetical protein
MRNLVPHLHRSFSQLAIVVRWNIMAGDVEEVGNWIVDRDEARKLSW